MEPRTGPVDLVRRGFSLALLTHSAQRTSQGLPVLGKAATASLCKVPGKAVVVFSSDPSIEHAVQQRWRGGRRWIAVLSEKDIRIAG
ncbi:Hypothetical protein UVM_LOCUS442 [uncultured virus]|nr:Hypothetical protein UVM_LOCUS442 [uncultured virus]